MAVLYFVVHCVMVDGRTHILVCKLCCLKAKLAFVAHFKCFGTVRVILTMSATVPACVLTVLKMWSLS